VGAAFFCLAVLAFSPAAVAAPAKVTLRVLYAGDPKSPRQDDFVNFLKEHFTTAEGADIATFKEKDAAKYDAVILDYGPLKRENQVVTMPKFSFSKNYSRPTITLGQSGGKVCAALKLKNGYL